MTDKAAGTSVTTIDGTYSDFAGTAPAGTVGADGAERTIINVAADSTDPVNGYQLNATNTAIENLQTGVGNPAGAVHCGNVAGNGLALAVL